MQSRMNWVARPPLLESSKLISLSLLALMWITSCGSAPLLTCSTSRLRPFTLTGRPHSSEMDANLGRKVPSSSPLVKPRVRAVEAALTRPPEWQASYMTNSLSVLAVMGLSSSLTSRLVRVPLWPPSYAKSASTQPPDAGSLKRVPWPL